MFYLIGDGVDSSGASILGYQWLVRRKSLRDKLRLWGFAGVSAPRSCAWVAADPGHRCDERGTVAAEDACHAACYAQELKNLKRETWSAKQPLRAP